MVQKTLIGVSLVLCLVAEYAGAQVTLTYDTALNPVTFASGKLEAVLASRGQSLVRWTRAKKKSPLPDVSVIVQGSIPNWVAGQVNDLDFKSIQPEGYAYRVVNQGNSLLILSVDAVGAMYGLLELAERTERAGVFQIPDEQRVNPSLAYRIVKFNLPWSPYRDSPATSVHLETCRDLMYWERFLDMMAENRLNVLSLWNNHPFPYMIRATNYPKATPFDDTEIQAWQKFWKALFRMAKDRGIQTFIVNWNIVVSPAFAEAYGAEEYNDLSEQVKKYTRESVTQVINEYEDLTGLGVTLADWMGTFDEKMTPRQREDWIEETFIAGIHEARRPVKFIHRSVLAGDPMAMRGVIDRADLPDDVLVEIKFNWSHGHSTPTLAITHDYHSGKLDDRFWNPAPTNYKIQWMIRNEDFFILRWGQPDFIRQHIALNKKDYVNGYFIGSEGYIPAADYSHRPSSAKTWQYAFEKQWLFYKVWGRLLYQQETSDVVFSNAFDVRYGNGIGVPLLEAYKRASNTPLRIASFHRSTWDYTLYAEGFIEAEPSAPGGVFDRSSPFISIDELIDHETLDPAMMSIPDYVQRILQGEKISSGILSPLTLADSCERDGLRALALVGDLRSRVTPASGALLSELDDVATWSYLGLYFADKIRAGVALAHYRRTGDESLKQESLRWIQACLKSWDQVIALTRDRYLPTPHVSTQHYGAEFKEFSWEALRPQVIRDIEIVKKSTGTR